MHLENLLKAFENKKTKITVILVDGYDTKIIHTGSVKSLKKKGFVCRVVQVYLEKDDSYTILVRPKEFPYSCHICPDAG